MIEKDEQHERDQNHSHEQIFVNGFRRAVDQVCPIVKCFEFDAWKHFAVVVAVEFLDFGFDVGQSRKGLFAFTQQNNALNGFGDFFPLSFVLSVELISAVFVLAGEADTDFS